MIDIVFSLIGDHRGRPGAACAGDGRGNRDRGAGDDGFGGTIADFIDKHPTLKILALSFLIVVGTLLIAEAFDVHVPKGYATSPWLSRSASRR